MALFLSYWPRSDPKVGPEVIRFHVKVPNEDHEMGNVLMMVLFLTR